MFLNAMLSPLTEGMTFSFCSSKFHKQHYGTSLCQQHFPFFNLVCTFTCILPVIFGHHALFHPLQSLTIFFTHHRYSSSKYVHIVAFHSLWLVQLSATCGYFALSRRLSCLFFKPGERMLKLATLPPIRNQHLFLILENIC